MAHLYGPESGVLLGHFFRQSFSRRSSSENGAPFSDNMGVRNWRLACCIVTGFHTSWEVQAFKCAENSSTRRIYLPSKQRCLLLAALRYRPARASGITTSRWDRTEHCDGVDYESLATFLADAIAAFSTRNHNLSRRGREQSPSEILHKRGASPWRDDARLGSAHSRNYRGCRQIEAINATVLPRGTSTQKINCT